MGQRKGPSNSAPARQTARVCDCECGHKTWPAPYVMYPEVEGRAVPRRLCIDCYPECSRG